MGCNIHPEREAVRRCDKCGQLMCRECFVDFDGRSVCKPCVARALNAAPGYYERAGTPRTKNSNLLIVFILSALPGMAHMYMGLMKRGLFIMSSFFISIWLVAEMHFSYFGFLIAMICVAAFFDAMNTRKRIVAGDYIEDGVADITGFISRFKTPLLIAAAYLIFTRFMNYGRFYFPYNNFYYGRVNNGLFLGVIIAVTITTLKKTKKKARDETIDVRDEQNRPY